MHEVQDFNPIKEPPSSATPAIVPLARETKPAQSQAHTGTAIRVLLLLSETLDCEGLRALLSQCAGLAVLDSTSDLEFGLARSRRLRPQVLIVDPRLDDQAIFQAAELVSAGLVKHVIALDYRFHEGLLARLLPLPAVSYLTRQMRLEELHQAIKSIVGESRRIFDPQIAHRVIRSPRGLRLELAADGPSVAALTARELEVLQHLAQGSTVRECARDLNLATSTIDNHKSRLMKKLRIHKATHLTLAAIRAGIISV